MVTLKDAGFRFRFLPLLVYPKPYTLNPKPYTLNPKPYTLGP